MDEIYELIPDLESTDDGKNELVGKNVSPMEITSENPEVDKSEFEKYVEDYEEEHREENEKWINTKEEDLIEDA